jgi:hypothetical protein
LLAVHVANVLAHPQQSSEHPAARSSLDLEHLAQAGLAGRVDAWRDALQQNPAQVA